MQNIEIKKSSLHDFEKIYPLLQEFNSPFSKQDWSHLFTYCWDGAEKFCGFHLENQEGVVGFMGLIFSCRYKDNQTYKFCNITSLIVKKEYRMFTPLFLKEVKKMNDIVLIALNPIHKAYLLWTKIGFIPIEKQYTIIPTINEKFYRKTRANVRELPIDFDQLDVENKRIITDHKKYNCKCIMFGNNTDYCVLIYRITHQIHFAIPVKKIHILYISDTALFNENIIDFLNAFGTRFGLLSAVYVDSRFLDRKHFLLSITKKFTFPKILCCNPFKDKIGVDILYSEAILL